MDWAARRHPDFCQRSIRYSRHSDDRRIGSTCRSRASLSRCGRRLALACSRSGDCRANEHDRVCLFWPRAQSSLRNPGESVRPLNASYSRWLIIRSGNFRLRWNGNGCDWHRYRWFDSDTGGPMRARRFQADRRAHPHLRARYRCRHPSTRLVRLPAALNVAGFSTRS